MRLAMAQMRMSECVQENLESSLRAMRLAKERGADLVFFPEVQLSPFFAMTPGGNADAWVSRLDGPEVAAFCAACKELALWASPNLYLEISGRRFDASLMIDACGKIRGISKMVHIFQAENFYECDYYAPSDDGFKVFDTPFGKLGIVICFDRHIPGSVRACALGGAELVLVPTANLSSEPMELFEWEMRVQAFQNLVNMAMCNRVGREGGKTFAGEALVAGPNGELLFKAKNSEELCIVDLDLGKVREVRQGRNWLRFG